MAAVSVVPLSTSPASNGHTTLNSAPLTSGPGGGAGRRPAAAGGAPLAGPTTPALEMEFVDGDVPVCFACRAALGDPGGESVVVSFANALWHTECFRCSKCQKLMQHDSNITILSDGAPVCEDCSYICSACRQPISNEAIVTGDESYHSECFRCRTCRSHISELIFAKTSLGVYCMSCHNERVTRSRRIAETRRSKSTKTVDGGPARLRDRPLVPVKTQIEQQQQQQQQQDPPPAGSSELAVPSLSPGPANAIPLHNESPSPDPSATTTIVQARQASLPKVHQASLQPAGPTSHLHLRRTSADHPSSPPPLSSSAGSGRFRDRRANSVDHPGSPPVPAPPPKDEHHHHPPAASSSSHLRAGSTPSADRALPGLPSARVVLPSQRQDSRALAEPPASAPEAKPSGLTVSSLEGGGGGGRSNRRSGFYGFSARPGAAAAYDSGTEGEGPGAGVDGGSTSPKSGPVTVPVIPEDQIEEEETATPATPPRSGPSPRKTNGVTKSDSQRPLSFYDPDTLLFLDAVASPTKQPPVQGPPEDKPAAAVAFPGTPPLLEAEEHLSPLIETAELVPSASSRREHVESEKAAEDLTRRVRQSILQTRGRKNGTASGEMHLDVDLVESLLKELESTKDKMKALQGDYNAMKRASRTAFAGFNMAREEYDREVAARREAEGQMVSLKAEMAELASRLAAADTLKGLQTQSAQLRTSVDGLQRKLSVLQVERDLKVAEVEALQKVDPKATPAEAPAQLAAVPRSLSTRLEVVKQGYRVQIDELARERDALAREVDHLRRVREGQTAELEELNKRSDALAAENEKAQRELEQAKALISRVSARPGVTGNPRGSSSGGSARRPHHLGHSPSLSSQHGFSSGNEGGGGGGNGSDENADPAAPTSRRFKWGKSHSQAKPAASSSSAASGAAAGQHQHRPSPSSLDALNGQIGWPHNFQPVSVLKPVRCVHCGDKLWGLAEVRCTGCGQYCHAKCAPNSLFGCAASHAAGAADEAEADLPSMFGNDLAAQVKVEGQPIPRIVTRCIDAVENNGLAFEGIYRKTGAMTQVKVVQACFDGRAPFDLNDTNRFNDISAITSALKNYFRMLPNPLFTFELHEAFITTSGMPEGPARVEAFERLVHQLPPPHFRTLEALMRHLHRVHLASADGNKMTPQNLGVVFGPTLLRSPNPQRQFSDMSGTTKVVEALVEHTAIIFRRAQGAETA